MYKYRPQGVFEPDEGAGGAWSKTTRGRASTDAVGMHLAPLSSLTSDLVGNLRRSMRLGVSMRAHLMNACASSECAWVRMGARVGARVCAWVRVRAWVCYAGALPLRPVDLAPTYHGVLRRPCFPSRRGT